VVDFDPLRDSLKHSAFVEVTDTRFVREAWGTSWCWTNNHGSSDVGTRYSGKMYRILHANGQRLWYCDKCIAAYLVEKGLIW